MPTVMAYHDVKDKDHWLASPTATSPRSRQAQPQLPLRLLGGSASDAPTSLVGGGAAPRREARGRATLPMLML